MDISNFSGVVPPVVTPLDENKKFDRDSFEKIINRLIDAGVNGLFILGSTGSVVFLTNKEREEVVKAACEINAGRVPLLIGCIDTQVNRIIEHIRVAEKYNADAIVVTAPFYAIDCSKIVERHFRDIRKATDLPIFAYDLPQCVGKKLDRHMLVKLGTEGVLNGVKDSSGDDFTFRYLCSDNEKAGHPLRIFTGHEVLVDAALLSGADGVVPGLGNVDPKLFVDLWNCFKSGDWKQMLDLQNKAAKLMNVINCTDEPLGFSSGAGGFITSLQLMGYAKTNNVPEPSIELNESETQRVAKILKEFNLV